MASRPDLKEEEEEEECPSAWQMDPKQMEDWDANVRLCAAALMRSRDLMRMREGEPTTVRTLEEMIKKRMRISDTDDAPISPSPRPFPEEEFAHADEQYYSKEELLEVVKREDVDEATLRKIDRSIDHMMRPETQEEIVRTEDAGLTDRKLRIARLVTKFMSEEEKRIPSERLMQIAEKSVPVEHHPPEKEKLTDEETQRAPISIMHREEESYPAIDSEIKSDYDDDDDKNKEQTRSSQAEYDEAHEWGRIAREAATRAFGPHAARPFQHVSVTRYCPNYGTLDVHSDVSDELVRHSASELSACAQTYALKRAHCISGQKPEPEHAEEMDDPKSVEPVPNAHEGEAREPPYKTLSDLGLVGQTISSIPWRSLYLPRGFTKSLMNIPVADLARSEIAPAIRSSFGIKRLKPHVKVFYGPMYGGKTRALFKHVLDYALGGFKCLVFKFQIDVRYDGDDLTEMKSHDQHSLSSKTHENITVLRVPCDHFERYLGSKIDIPEAEQSAVIAVDEGQFASGENMLVRLAERWVDRGGKVLVVAGLNLWASGDIVRTVMDLVPISEKPKFKAGRCRNCGSGIAVRSVLIEDFKAGFPYLGAPRVRQGGKDVYTSICRECYFTAKWDLVD